MRREQNRSTTATIARIVNTDAKAYIFPGDSPMTREDVRGYRQKEVQIQKTGCRLAKVNPDKKKKGRNIQLYGQGCICATKKSEAPYTCKASLNKQSTLGFNTSHSPPRIPPEDGTSYVKCRVYHPLPRAYWCIFGSSIKNSQSLEWKAINEVSLSESLYSRAFFRPIQSILSESQGRSPLHVILSASDFLGVR